MVNYEITYILRPSLEEADVEARTAAFAQIVTKQGGSVEAVEKLGKKRLAYEIKDLREGHYATMHFNSLPPVAHELERQLKLNEDVLRTLIIKLDKHEYAAVLAARASAAAAAAAAPAPPPLPAE